MKIAELKKQSVRKLGEQHNGLEVDLWLGEVLKKSKEWIFMNVDFDLSTEQEERFWEGVNELKKGRPLAQLTGKKEFYGLDFKVNDQVLIPRPETELVVDLAKDFIAKKLVSQEVVKVIDVGTGSGCIILALAKVAGQVKGLGVDVSNEALKIAEENREMLGLIDQVELRQGNLLEGINDSYDIIVANLPYIGRDRFNFVAKDVADFEPEVALFGGSDGLELYRKMFKQLLEKSWCPSLMIGEFGFGQEEEMLKVLGENFLNFEVINDLAGIPRVFLVNFI